MNKFKEYGFKRKMFEYLYTTGVQGDALRGTHFGYTRKIKVNAENETTFEIIPCDKEWKCNITIFNGKIFNESFDYKITNIKEYQESNLGKIEYGLKKLGYGSYYKYIELPIMKTKELILEEIILQYGDLF